MSTERVVKLYDANDLPKVRFQDDEAQYNEEKKTFDPTKIHDDDDIVKKIGKYQRASKTKIKVKKNETLRRRLLKNSREDKDAAILAARSEILLTEEAGYLEAEGIEKTTSFTQEKIKPHLSISAASKSFDIELKELGPYNVDYTRNGKYVLIGGRKGHVATFDWKAGVLGCELQLRETLKDIKWLHNETLFATAQKKYVYIYDRNGLEVHCLKKQTRVNQLDFLPYHFLLTSIGDLGILKYLDISTGNTISEHFSQMGRTDILTHNPQNAIVHTGHSNGTVALWSPNSKESLIKMLCHKGPVQSVSIDSSGRYMATAGKDATLKVWDLRTYKPLYEYYTTSIAGKIEFSQRGLLAVGYNGLISVWKDVTKSKQQAPYMQHRFDPKKFQDLKFCPYEDVLGFGHSQGFSSIIIPGSGEPNFDSLEVNPYETKKQRQEQEVHALLNKVQPDTIMLDSNILGSVYNQLDSSDEDEKLNSQDKKVEIKHRARGKSSSSKRFIRKKGIAELMAKKERAKKMLKEHRKKERTSNDMDRINPPKFNKPTKGAALNTFIKKKKN